jgi:hypothetical protein
MGAGTLYLRDHRAARRVERNEPILEMPFATAAAPIAPAGSRGTAIELQGEIHHRRG